MFNKEIGFWREDIYSNENLPWPVSDEFFWRGRKKIFLENLHKIEQASSSFSFHGNIPCKLCNKQNGKREFNYDNKYIFPGSLRHYVKDHNVILPEDFVEFVVEYQE